VRPLQTLTEVVEPEARHRHGIGAVVRHLGGFGLFLFAIVDGSPIPAFGGLDILTAILAARQREPWYYYATIATAGSIIGAYITFRMARKAGLEYLNRRVGIREVAKIQKYFEKWGTGALVVCTVVPAPLPTSTFFGIAGVLDYPFQRFMLIVAVGRALRYGVEAAVASYYGRRFVVTLRHLGRHPGWLLAIAATVVIAVSAAIVLSKRQQSSRSAINTHAR